MHLIDETRNVILPCNYATYTYIMKVLCNLWLEISPDFYLISFVTSNKALLLVTKSNNYHMTKLFIFILLEGFILSSNNGYS